MDDERFFHLPSTHEFVDMMSDMGPVTIFVGAGASIEKTGLTWAALSALLLDPELGTYDERVEIVRALPSPLAVSSAIAQEHLTGNAGEWRRRLNEDIRGCISRRSKY